MLLKMIQGLQGLQRFTRFTKLKGRITNVMSDTYYIDKLQTNDHKRNYKKKKYGMHLKSTPGPQSKIKSASNPKELIKQRKAKTKGSKVNPKERGVRKLMN